MFRKLSDFVKKGSTQITKVIEKTDREYNISEVARGAAEQSAKAISEGVKLAQEGANTAAEIYDQSGVKKIVDKNLNVISKELNDVKDRSGAIYKESGVKVIVNQGLTVINQKVDDLKDHSGVIYEESGAKATVEEGQDALSRGFAEARDAAVELYGDIRKPIKSYSPPRNAEELLVNTREELVFVNACILQVSAKESEEIAARFGKVVSGKIVGLASAGGLFALVSTFGSAANGTAIAGLAGAAANSATLAWIGGLVGGGMAAGAIVTGGLGLLVGAVLYSKLSSEPRDVNSLSVEESKIVQSSSLLIAAIEEVLQKKPVQLSVTEAKQLQSNVIVPLNDQLKMHKSKIVTELNPINQLRFKEHALPDFQGNVVEGFEHYIKDTPLKLSPAFAISGVIYALLRGTEFQHTPENDLAVDALRRMNNDWAELDLDELGDALSEYSADGLKGVANNAKGIYHELLFVKDFNSQNEDVQARLFEKTNEPGADIQIFNVGTGDVVREAQLKALQESSGIHHHFDRYPDIDIIATEEIAGAFENVQSSGFTNEDITNSMNSVISELSDDNSFGVATETAGISVLISAGKQAIDVLNGTQDVKGAGKETLVNASVATGSALLATFLFS